MAHSPCVMFLELSDFDGVGRFERVFLMYSAS